MQEAGTQSHPGRSSWKERGSRSTGLEVESAAVNQASIGNILSIEKCKAGRTRLTQLAR